MLLSQQDSLRRRAGMHALCVSLLLSTGSAANSANVTLQQEYEANWAPRLVPMLSEVIRFPTIAGREQAFIDQKAWLTLVATGLGFTVRDKGKVTEVELPGPAGAPVLGLAVHGDVQPVDDHWTIPPFAGVVKDGMVLGRGSADDKGPLVQALLAMKVLKESGRVRTHTIRLLVGSDEESGSTDMKEYRQANAAPDVTLVLDSNFPVIVGERAWNALTVEAPLAGRAASPLKVVSMSGGLAASIVADTATLQLSVAAQSQADVAAVESLQQRLLAKKLPEGTQLVVKRSAAGLQITARGKAAHAGVNPAGGRNAIVALATALAGELPEGGARDLLDFAQLAGQDLQGSGLGLTQVDPVFGRVIAVPAVLRTEAGGRARLTINIRSNPNLSGEPLKQFLNAQVAAFNGRTGAVLVAGGIYGERVLAFNPQAKIVKRLLAAYERATGKAAPPAVSGGGTYAKSLPNAIAFGMWFPDKPYPGHDVDEQVSIADLHKGVHVLLEALADIACGAPMKEPFKP
jgi:succinyl-diaminopimelate desuccinylase